MNLYLFNANDSAAMYGIGAYLNELTSALEGNNINIHIVHLHSIRPEFEIVKTNHVEHWHIPEVRNQNTFSGSIQKLEDYYRNVIYLLRIHIKDTTDLVFHFNYNQSRLLAKELKAAFDCKTVYTVHFLKWMLELHGNLDRFKALKAKPADQRTPFEQLLLTTDEYESMLFREVDRVIALSQYTQNLLCSEYGLEPDRVLVIPNGLRTVDNAETDNNLSLREKWRISEKELLILFVGRLHPVKGLHFLIRAFRKVLESLPYCRLMIAGSGNFEPYLHAAQNICTKVTFTGLLGKNELYELYQIADIGVMPSFHEQCSYVAIEMMMHGLSVIGSTTTGLKEMIADSETGLHIPVVEYGDRVEIDINLLAEKMLYLLQHPKERRRLGQNARKRYEAVYSAEVFRRNMTEFYSHLCRQEAKHPQSR